MIVCCIIPDDAITCKRVVVAAARAAGRVRLLEEPRPQQAEGQAVLVLGEGPTDRQINICDK